MLIYLLLLSTAAAEPAAVAATDAAKEPATKERMICKSDYYVGTHISQRICKTETEWRIGKENAKDTLDAIGRGNNYQTPTGPGK